MNVFELFAKVSVNKSQAVNDIRAIETAGKRASTSMGQGFQKLSDNVGKWVKRGAVVAAGAMAALGATSLKNFAKMDTGMREVFTLMPGLSEKAKQQMTADVKEISRAIGVLPNETIPALYQAISAGVPQDNVFEFMEIAGKAAKAGVTDLETAVDALSSVVNAYGAEVISATEASDIMFTAVRLGKTTFGELSRYLFQVTPVAAATGVSFNQIAAALAEITAKGVPTRVAATQLRQMLVELSKAGGETANIFEELSGQTFPDFMDAGNDLSDVLALMQEYADANSISLMDMFSSVEGGMAALNLGGANIDSFRAKLGEMEETALATEVAFQEMAAGIQFRLDQLAAWWQTVQINIGGELQEGLEDLLSWLEANQDKIEAGLIKAFEVAIDGLEWLIRNHGAIKTSLLVLATGFLAVRVAIDPLSAAIGLLTGGIALFILGVESTEEAVLSAAVKLAIWEDALDEADTSVGTAADAISSLDRNLRALAVSYNLSSLMSTTFASAIGMITAAAHDLWEEEMMSPEAFNALVSGMEDVRVELESLPVEQQAVIWRARLDELLVSLGENYEGFDLLIAAFRGVVPVAESAVEVLDETSDSLDELDLATARFLEGFANVTTGIEGTVGPITGAIRKIRNAYRNLVGSSDATAEEVQESWSNLVTGVASSMNSFLDSVSEMYRTNRELTEEHNEALEEIEGESAERLGDLATSRVEDRAKINASANTSSESERQRHVDKLAQIERTYQDKMRRMADDDADAAREAAFIRNRSTQDEADKHAENMTTIQTGMVTDLSKADSDYTDAVTAANQARTDARDDEVAAYEEAKISIWDILKEMVRNVLVAVREELLLQSAKYLVMGGAALLSLATMALAPGYFLTSAALAAGAAGLAIAGFAKGGIATSPTVGVVAEAGVSEGVIPLTMRNLAAIGRGIATASGFSREPLGSTGIPGLSGGGVQLSDAVYPQAGGGGRRDERDPGLGGGMQVNITIENPVIRDDGDIDKLVEGIEDSFAQTRRGLGWAGAT